MVDMVVYHVVYYYFIFRQSALWYKYISFGGMLYVIPSCGDNCVMI